MEKVFEQLCAECRSYTGPGENNKGTMLHFTVKSKHDKCMEVLLNGGVDVNVIVTDDSLFTPLMRTAQNGYVDGVQRLIQAGANVNRRSKNNKTALILATYEGYDECVKLLLSAGADVNVLTNGRYKHLTALHVAVESKNFKTGAGVNRRSQGNETGVERFEGPDRCVELLLKAPADVNALTDGPCEHVTALHSAVNSKNITHVKLLLQVGADVNKEGYESSLENKGVTALSLAAEDGFDEVVELLIEAGADVNKVPTNSFLPVMETLQHYEGDVNKHRERCIELLLAAGADVNIEYSDYTTLLLALDHSFHEAVDLLIRAGADVN